jgi:hypothetical protein
MYHLTYQVGSSIRNVVHIRAHIQCVTFHDRAPAVVELQFRVMRKEVMYAPFPLRLRILDVVVGLAEVNLGVGKYLRKKLEEDLWRGKV